MRRANPTLRLLLLLPLLWAAPVQAALQHNVFLKDSGDGVGTIRVLNESGSCATFEDCADHIFLGSAFYILALDLNDPGAISSVIPTQASWQVQPDWSLVLSMEGLFNPAIAPIRVTYSAGATPGEGTLSYFSSDTATLLASAEVVLAPDAYNSVVSLPGSLPMFVGALAGLGLAGFGATRRERRV